MAVVNIGNLPVIGSTNIPLYSTDLYSHGDDYPDIDNHDFSDSWGGRYHDRVRRQDTVSDINWGMTILANSIKVFSAILTILAVDDTDR